MGGVPNCMPSLISLPPPCSRSRGACIAAVALGTGLLLACGGSATGDADPPDGGIVGCQSYAGLEDYAPKLVKHGQAKAFTFVLVSSTPTPPAVEQNTWVVQVLDASNNPVNGATLTSVVPYMPTMGHGTSTPQVTMNPGGSFTISSIYLFMPGIWQTTIVAEAGQMKDSVAFTFCIAG